MGKKGSAFVIYLMKVYANDEMSDSTLMEPLNKVEKEEKDVDVTCSIAGESKDDTKHHRSDDDIFIAVRIWCDCRDEAMIECGHISDWNVSRVTNMESFSKEKKHSMMILVVGTCRR